LTSFLKIFFSFIKIENLKVLNFFYNSNFYRFEDLARMTIIHRKMENFVEIQKKKLAKSKDASDFLFSYLQYN